LHLAASYGLVMELQGLLDDGADHSRKGNLGNTLQMGAAEKGFKNVIHALLEIIPSCTR